MHRFFDGKKSSTGKIFDGKKSSTGKAFVGKSLRREKVFDGRSLRRKKSRDSVTYQSFEVIFFLKSINDVTSVSETY